MSIDANCSKLHKENAQKSLLQSAPLITYIMELKTKHAIFHHNVL